MPKTSNVTPMADVIARKATPVQNVNVVIVVTMVTLIVKASNIDCYALSKLACIVAEGNIVSCQCFVVSRRAKTRKHFVRSITCSIRKIVFLVLKHVGSLEN